MVLMTAPGLGGIFVTVRRNIVWECWARKRDNAEFGGGVIDVFGVNYELVENTVVGCRTDASYGGAISCDFGGYSGTPLIARNILAYCVGGGIQCGTGATPLLQDNLAWQNSGGDGVGECPAWWDRNGNIVADPFFCDRENGDFSLRDDSPAYNAPNGPIGAVPEIGCKGTPVERTTWGRLKALYK